MTKKKESVIETVTIECPHCGKIVEITEGAISSYYSCDGTIPIYIENGEVQLDWSNLDIHDITFDYYCPACGQQVTNWKDTLEVLHEEHKKALTKKKTKNESRGSKS